ncbi:MULTISPECIES: bifunctional serine/threonine-protein kinase/formylglycine-generating enzyme family protein [Limnospira]|uniref:Serine/threonine protein kinase n=1 Tax=Limnospira maxima CS-328 TaxID=513049 RepID=B5W4V3_LIMMA|nr:SUMF1/EgtB/PvdO family nonheme iron enzyme [Limnospira maxima]EDZ93413.1 serine/threonine protein kinase [Limnospira maxima CS-328]EKD06699.1 serine/threonine protein kinase [Arthrospira platensis C1]UWU48712.1 Formylglycine-generating enzyme, required for sulfatase activity, contains SUMF1/FGE domain [Arthrospira platensis C1]
MSQCLNPDCLHSNPEDSQFCQKCGSKLRLAERYYAKSILGQGGFGRTFLAVDDFKPSQPPCVIKQFLPQAQGTATLEKAAQLFDQEAQRLELLGKHSQIPELLAYFTADNRQYLIQEFIEGDTLQQQLDNQGAFTENQIISLLEDLLPVLDFVHQNQVIHRDIKPENIIRRASDNKLVLVDFGAAKQVHSTSLSVTGTVIGSAAYCAPEQAMGKPQYGSDLYSLGVTCLYLLTQVSPSNLYDPLELQWVWREHLNDNQLSEKLGKILDRLVETVFNKRYQSVAQVWADLQPSDDSPKPPTQKFKFDIVTVNSMGREINRRPGQAECIIEDLGNSVTLEMVLIPGGTFIMGASSGEPRSSNAERPQHQVTIKPFLMGKYPVTQAQWRQVASFPKLQRNLSLDPSRFKGFNLPVEKVSWYDVVEWCDRLSKVISKPCRLPSEAEWEYAARAGRTSPFHVGDTLTTDLANYDGNYSYSSGLKGVFRKKTTPVGRFQSANAFGLYDIHGNVWEWCADPWRDNYNGAPSDGTVWDSQDIDVDNLVKLLESKDRRVLRGGSWSNLPVFCRCASRNSAYPGNLLHNFGFRVACAL